MFKVTLSRSPRREKKWRVTFEDGKHVDFGARGMSDYTLHGDPNRMKLYLKRHAKSGETWTKKGLRSAGFWSRWLLWSQPSLKESIKYMNKKFNLKIKCV